MGWAGPVIDQSTRWMGVALLRGWGLSPGKPFQEKLKGVSQWQDHGQHSPPSYVVPPWTSVSPSDSNFATFLRCSAPLTETKWLFFTIWFLTKGSHPPKFSAPSPSRPCTSQILKENQIFCSTQNFSPGGDSAGLRASKKS